MGKSIEVPHTEIQAVRIYICKNVDGIHTESRYLGYITGHPFTIFAKMIGNYYIAKYNDHLVHEQMFTKEEYAIEIKSMAIQNETVYSYDRFIQIYKSELDKCKVTKENMDEYVRLLSISKEKEPLVQKAIDCLDLISSIKDGISLGNIIKLMPENKNMPGHLDPDLILLYSDIILDYAEAYSKDLYDWRK